VQKLYSPFGLQKDALQQKMKTIQFKGMIVWVNQGCCSTWQKVYRAVFQVKNLFVAKVDAGSTRPRKEYEMKQTDDRGNF
jgi:hypothetical protein